MTRSFRIDPPIQVLVEENQPIVLMSDLHIGSRDMDVMRLRADLEMIKKNNAVVLINGDVLDMILPSDRRYEISSQHMDYSNHMVNQHINLALELLKPIAPQIKMIGIGNHEHTAIVKYHVDPIKILINDLYRETGASIVYGGYEGFVVFQVMDYRERKYRSRFFMRYHHGWGGTPKSGTRTAHNDLRASAVADIFWIGHKHLPEVSWSRVLVPHISHVEARDVLHVSTGSYLTSYSDRRESYTPYPILRGMAMSATRACVTLAIRNGRVEVASF